MSKKEVAAALASKELLASENTTLQERISKLEEQLSWYQRQVFGKKSERRVPEGSSKQDNLFDLSEFADFDEHPEDKIDIKGHTRRKRKALKGDDEASEGSFPEHLRREVVIVDEKPEGYALEQLEELGEKVTERLAEKPGEQYVIQYRRKVYKIKETGEIKAPEAPAHIFGRCKVDESFLVLLVIKKFLWHWVTRRLLKLGNWKEGVMLH